MLSDWQCCSFLGSLFRPAFFGAVRPVALMQPFWGFFVVASPERHVLFAFSEKHNSAAVDAILGDYKGVLVADAHTV